VKETILTPRFAQALTYANHTHRAQRRKGSGAPYIGHLLGVADIVLNAGGDEDEAIAALLHDTAEDQGGRGRLDDIRARFGERVAGLVDALSDALPDEPGARKPPWHARKAAYHENLRSSGASVRLVSAADKLNNARATLTDLRAHGPSVWQRFSATPAEQLWNYECLLEIYRGGDDPRIGPILEDLGRTIAELRTLIDT
jgi:(p)ppGpp synthase/HD superfamily hydrolase